MCNDREIYGSIMVAPPFYNACYEINTNYYNLRNGR